jgi:hypothetical protein
MKKKTPDQSFKYLMGADPEFTITFRGEKIAASTVEQILFNSTHNNIPEGQVGCDGCSSTGEIRPNASDNLKDMVKNVGACLKLIATNLPEGFDLTTISMYSPIGGHIHLNMPFGYANKDKYTKILPVLCFPIFVGENNISNAMRIAGGYGSMVDHRDQGTWDKDGKRYSRFEMRGLSAEWLISEKICRGVLAYVEMVNEELIENPKIYDMAKELMVKSSQDENLLSSIYLTKNKMFIPVIMEKISRMVKKFKRYKDFKEEVDFILDYKKVLIEKKRCEYSIIKGWKFKQPKKIKEEHLKKLNGLISVAYNSDINMDKFAESLGNEILLNNWNKNQYMIFGVKEIEQFLPFIWEKGRVKFIEVKGYETFIKNKENLVIATNKAVRMGERFNVNSEIERNYIWNKEKTKMTVKDKPRIIIGIPRNIREKNRFNSLNKLIKTIESNKFKEIETNSLASSVKPLIPATDQKIETTKEETICAE